MVTEWRTNLDGLMSKTEADATVAAIEAAIADLWVAMPGATNIAVGSVTGLSAGATPIVANSGSSTNVVLDFGIPAGSAGAAGSSFTYGSGAPSGGANGDMYLRTSSYDMYYRSGGSWSVIGNVKGADGAAGVNAFGAPVARSLSFATAYQASTPAKPALVTVIVDLTTTVAVGTPQANTAELIVGSTTGVASGTGTLADTYRNDLTVTLISLGFTGRQKLQASVPAGYYFAIRRTVGTGITIVSAFDQTVG